LPAPNSLKAVLAVNLMSGGPKRPNDPYATVAGCEQEARKTYRAIAARQGTELADQIFERAKWTKTKQHSLRDREIWTFYTLAKSQGWTAVEAARALIAQQETLPKEERIIDTQSQTAIIRKFNRLKRKREK
jgi:hypothetical protein